MIPSELQQLEMFVLRRIHSWIHICITSSYRRTLSLEMANKTAHFGISSFFISAWISSWVSKFCSWGRAQLLGDRNNQCSERKQCEVHDSLGAGLFLSHAFLVNVEVALLRKQPRNRTLGNTSLPRWFLVAKNVWFCFCSNQFLWLFSNSSCVGTLFGELVRVVFL